MICYDINMNIYLINLSVATSCPNQQEEHATVLGANLGQGKVPEVRQPPQIRITRNTQQEGRFIWTWDETKPWHMGVSMAMGVPLVIIFFNGMSPIRKPTILGIPIYGPPISWLKRKGMQGSTRQSPMRDSDEKMSCQTAVQILSKCYHLN